MEGSELRVGNYALAYGKEILQCTGIAKGLFWFQPDLSISAFQDAHSINAMSGIPLTPEILEACGFVLSEDGEGVYHWDRPDCAIDFQSESDSAPKQVNPVLDYNLVHLHQLQNLYFAHKGIELPVSLATNQPA
jgi:hypothetical protein